MLATTIDLVSVPRESRADGRRGLDRKAVAQPSTLRGNDRAPHPVTIEDLSAHGFRFTSDTQFDVGSVVQVGLSGAGTANARIVWRDATTHGSVFLSPLSQTALDEAFGAQGQTLVTFPGMLESIADPEVQRWSGATRVNILVGLVAASWALIIGAAALL